jgi:hypothetical protein
MNTPVRGSPAEQPSRSEMRQRQRRQLGGTFVAFSVRTLMPGSRSAFGRDKGSAQTRPGGRSLTKGPLAHRLDRAGLSRVGLGVQIRVAGAAVSMLERCRDETLAYTFRSLPGK